jgi:Arc/MetJ-type ribon-helix-helix transcriptional regulator
VRLPDDQVARIDRLVGVLLTSRSDVIRRAIELYLYRLACEHDATTPACTNASL